MNWFIRALRAASASEASSTNYSNLLNSAFGNGWGDMDEDEAKDEAADPAKGEGEKKKPGRRRASCHGCCRLR